MDGPGWVPIKLYLCKQTADHIWLTGCHLPTLNLGNDCFPSLLTLSSVHISDSGRKRWCARWQTRRIWENPLLKNTLPVQITFRRTDQRTEQVDSLQHEFLVPDPRDAQLLQVLVGDAQQLLAVYLLPLELVDVLLQAVVQPWHESKRGH